MLGPGRGGDREGLTLFFATDLHGSLVCFKKFLAAAEFYGADVSILGGDMTGKMVVPVVRGARGTYRARVAGREIEVGEDEVGALETRIADAGFYPYRTDPDEVAELEADPARIDQLFDRLMADTLRLWAKLADSKFAGTDRVIYVAPGNDDPHCIDEVLAELPRFRVVEGEVVTLGESYEMLSTGFSNTTPWRTHRELEEAELRERIDKLAARVSSMDTAVFNIHVPPYNTGIDTGPDVDPHTWEQRSTMGHGHTKPVGSVAVREAIEAHQPLLSLHGHIHESRGTARLGRTLCVNPGSDYGDGILRGCLIHLVGARIRGFQLTSG
jgi:Icc-related predicted phosphoesterase